MKDCENLYDGLCTVLRAVWLNHEDESLTRPSGTIRWPAAALLPELPRMNFMTPPAPAWCGNTGRRCEAKSRMKSKRSN
jgi:hypothetical protein